MSSIWLLITAPLLFCEREDDNHVPRQVKMKGMDGVAGRRDSALWQHPTQC